MFCGMPKRKRNKELRPAVMPSAAAGGAVPTALSRAESEQERAAKLFAESISAHEAADRAARDRAAAAAAHDRRHQDLVAAKETAAARLRRLRGDGRPRAQMAEAEAAYRSALAALTEFETGERPHWAPATPAADGDEGDGSGVGPGAEAGDDDSAESQPS